MARDENPPFPRGSTYFGGDSTLIDANVGSHLEGTEWVFEDNDPASMTQRTNRKVTCRIVRNKAATALLPKRLAALKDGQGGQIDGYARTTAARGYPIDEYLPAAGVAVNDLCYIVVKGPAVVKTSLAGGASNNFAVLDNLVAATAATSGATTAGRVEKQDLTGATQPLADQIQNKVGAACTARTTNNTDSDVLVDVAWDG